MISAGRQIMESIVIPTANLHSLTFQDDNAPLTELQRFANCFTILKFLLSHGNHDLLTYRQSSTPGTFLDERWTRECYSVPAANLTELGERLLRQCEQLDVFCDLMAKRLQACLQGRGGHTHYWHLYIFHWNSPFESYKLRNGLFYIDDFLSRSACWSTL